MTMKTPMFLQVWCPRPFKAKVWCILGPSGSVNFSNNESAIGAIIKGSIKGSLVTREESTDGCFCHPASLDPGTYCLPTPPPWLMGVLVTSWWEREIPRLIQKVGENLK